MNLSCSWEDSTYSGTSTGSDVIMMSTYIFSSALLKTQMALSEKTVRFRAFSIMHSQETML